MLFRSEGRLRRDDLVWNETLPTWMSAGSVSGFFDPGAPPPLPMSEVGSTASGNRIAAGLCGILLGAIGVHKFLLGNNTAGLIMLCVTILTCGVGGLVMHTIGLIEGIIYLTTPDDVFYQRYVVEKKEWF